MYRVLVVDDEVPFCRALSRMIAELQPQFTVVGEAYDGEEALEAIAALQPDVVITDIRMQMMDGLQLLEIAKKANPELIAVVLSAYPDFHYAQRALQLQTEDYLVKPVKEKELRALLDRLAVKCGQLRERAEANVLQDLLSHKPVPKVPPTMRFASYRLYLVCAGAYCTMAEDPLHPGIVYWETEDRRSGIGDHLPLSARHWLTEGAFDNERLLLVGWPDDGRTEEADALGQTLLRALEGGAVPLTLVASPAFAELSELAAVAYDLRKKLVKGAVFGRSAAIGNEDRQASVYDLRFDEWERKLAEAMAAGNKDSFLYLLRSWLEEGRQAGWRQLTVARALKRTADLLERTALQHEREAAFPHPWTLELEAAVSGAVGYEDLLQNVSFQFAPLLADQTRPKPGADYHDKFVAEVAGYLEQRFAQPITLQDLSRQFGLVPGYISQLFRKGTGLTPGEYVTDLRVAAAKRLMGEQPGILLKQVAEAVGFQDPLYFSKVFKKATGVPPSHYMK
ncbi:response regulator [Paenibacillus cymbidii]|uniref:response regulator n=1 Tax=Paenibacillus cymbidii TaxID=1639034 RepID=UPI0010808BC3|nr:response regulator [Paenibacillus cymbidii]